ncbi:MAG: hypothetical protein N4A70_19180 [Pelagimonas sp.]|jgi:hypothetical protein|nr:hypothetical protein [Pelagimonas sp.]
MSKRVNMYSPSPIYFSERQTAEFLGYSVEWLRKNVLQLEQQYGFPRIDPAIGKRHAPSIEVWAQERNSRHRQIEQVKTHSATGNTHAF